jgi:arsenite/tail-anchored protein-transporting ATPase
MDWMMHKKLVFFSGKGGTGKTTCAVAAGLYAGKKGKKTLIVSTDPAHSLGDLLEINLSDTPTLVEKNVNALEIDTAQAFLEFKKAYGDAIKKIFSEGTYFTEKEINEFFEITLPGLDEFMALLKIAELTEEQYDLILVDTAPSGHTFRLLESPELLNTFLKVLESMHQKHTAIRSFVSRSFVKEKTDAFLAFMHARITKLTSQLMDNTQTGFVIVTIPEKMAIAETRDFLAFLHTHQCGVDMIVMNNLTPENTCRFCHKKRTYERAEIEILKKERFPITPIPLFPGEITRKTIPLIINSLCHAPYTIPSTPVKSIEIMPSFSRLSQMIGTSPRVVFFGGKGGTGKTTCANAFAMAASKNKKTLVISTDPAHSLGDSFGTKVDSTPTRIQKNLYGLEIDARQSWNAMKKAYRHHVRSFFDGTRIAQRGVQVNIGFDEKIITGLIDLTPPGLDELMALKEVVTLIDQNEFELIVIDTAPTGHALRLLQMPGIVVEWFDVVMQSVSMIGGESGFAAELSDMETKMNRLNALLKSVETVFVVVAIPEKLAFLETTDLLRELNALNISCPGIIINKLQPKGCAYCTEIRNRQMLVLNQFTECNKPLVVIPRMEKAVSGNPALTKMSGLLG